MSNVSFEDCVAIDTNVFEHILNRCENIDFHINSLLARLQDKRTHLVMDNKNRIAGEYNNRIGPMIRRADDTLDEIFVLRYWILNAPRTVTELDMGDSLMTAIKQVIHEQTETVDRILVYVAFKVGSTLISNDRMHIVDGPPNESAPRRRRLLREHSEASP